MYAKPPTPPVGIPVHIKNLRTTDILVGDPMKPCRLMPFFFVGAGGDPPPVWSPSPPSMVPSCDSLMSNGACSGDAQCLPPVLARIVPGGTYTTTWAGFDWNSDAMPGSCYANPTCNSTICWYPRTSGGSRNVDVEVASMPLCGGSPCTCTPDASGSCEVQGPFTGDVSPFGGGMWTSGQATMDLTVGP